MSKQTDLINIPDAITVSGSNVGINDTAPSSLLQLTQTSDNASGGLQIRNTADSNSIYIYQDGNVTTYDAGSSGEQALKTGNSERMRIDSSGNVGIGTSSPSYTLEVYKSSVGNVASFNSSSGNRSLDFTSADNGAYLGAEWDRNINSAGGIHTWSVNDAERMRIDSSGNVGIGGTPSNQLHLQKSADNGVVIENTTGATLSLLSTGAGRVRSSGVLLFDTGGATERMRIDSSGNLLVGKTSFNHANAGAMLASDGRAYSTVDGNSTFTANRLSSDGEIIRIQKDTVTVGSIGTLSSVGVYIGTGDTGLVFRGSQDTILPWNPSTNYYRDNAIDLGDSGSRFDDIYATNGTIQTSDFNEKQDIASLTATEMLVGKRISALFKTFRWKDSVAEKGDNARTHTGVIAQDVQAAFTAEGLDAGDYALFISSTWWEHDVDVPAVEAVEAVDAVTETTTDEDGNEVVTVITEAVEAVEAKDAYTRTDTYDTEAEAPEGATSKTRLGIRYPELLSFVAAYNEQRFASIEARLTALEA
jgi:hypothetical protein